MRRTGGRIRCWRPARAATLGNATFRRGEHYQKVSWATIGRLVGSSGEAGPKAVRPPSGPAVRPGHAQTARTARSRDNATIGTSAAARRVTNQSTLGGHVLGHGRDHRLAVLLQGLRLAVMLEVDRELVHPQRSKLLQTCYMVSG